MGSTENRGRVLANGIGPSSVAHTSPIDRLANLHHSGSGNPQQHGHTSSSSAHDHARLAAAAAAAAGTEGDQQPTTVTSSVTASADEAPEYDESIIHKTILVGDSGVGKTSLLVQFDQKKFQPGSFAATVGIGFTNKVVTVDGSKVKLQIWDTAGQERFRSITHAYYRDAHALLLLYDITSKASFDNISAWLAEINEFAQDDVVIILIGNKADMSAERSVRKEEGIRVAKDYGVAFMETSAKTGQNVDNAFVSVARDLKMKKTRGHAIEDGNSSVHVSSDASAGAAGSSGSVFACCSS